MVRLLIGVVASRIVTADHGPAGLIGGVFSRGMEKIAVEEQHIAGIHLDVNKRETLEDSGHAFLVGAGLISLQYVVDSFEQMRTLDDQKAAIFASGWIDSNRCVAEIGGADAILIPVTVVLMPGPGAAGLRIFHDHLRMVVINLVVENPLGGVDDGFAAREHSVDSVTGVVPKGKADNLAAAVVPSEGVVVKGLILLRGTPKQVDFLRIEHPADERVALLPVFSESIWSDGAVGHKRSSYFGVSHRVQARTRSACDKVWCEAKRDLKECIRIYRVCGGHYHVAMAENPSDLWQIPKKLPQRTVST